VIKRYHQTILSSAHSLGHTAMSSGSKSDTEKALALAAVSDFHEYFSSPPPFTNGSHFALPHAMIVVPMGDLSIETFSAMYERVGPMLAKSYEAGRTGFRHWLTEPEAEIWVSGNIAAVLVGWTATLDGQTTLLHTVNLCTLHRLSDGYAPGENPWRISGLVDMAHLPPEMPVPAVEKDVPEVTALFETLVGRINAKDWQSIPRLLLSGSGATISQDAGVPETFLWPELIKRLQVEAESGPVAEKRLLNCESRRCSDLAFVWAPFVLITDGVERARGIDVCSFRLEKGEWLTSGLQETMTSNQASTG
jgi:hypothetical protein